MKLFIYGNNSSCMTSVQKAIATHGDYCGVSAYSKIITPDLTKPCQELFDDLDFYELQTADAIMTWGTWGSLHPKRVWDPYGKRFGQGFKEVVNKFANNLATGLQIPRLVCETATISRCRTNYLDVASFKDVRPMYYRLGLDHWTYEKATWVEPKYNRLSKFISDTKKAKDIDLNVFNHSWNNNKDGDIWVLAGLEQDPTSTTPVRQWITKTVQQLKKHSNRRIIVKLHPLSSLKMDSIEKGNVVLFKEDNTKLSVYYNKMYCAVVDNSTSVFELLDYGIPVFCNNDNFARELKNIDLTKIEDIYYANTLEYIEWANKICHTEFSLDEWEDDTILFYIKHLVEKGSTIGN